MKTLKKLVRLSIDWTEDSWAPKVSFARFAIPVPRLAPLPLAPMNHRCYSPGSSALFGSRGSRGFTLVEMLVVIGIIAILAGILLPVLAGVKDKAKATTARTEMANLISAVSAYESEYSRPPASREAEQHAASGSDFTYGTSSDGGVLTGRNGPLELVANPGVGAGTHQTNNCVVMRVIMDLDFYPNSPNHARNPRRHATFNAKPSSGPGFSGLDSDGILRDPWGNPYIITVDMNDDNKCDDAFYSNPKPPRGVIQAPVVVWSFGKDGRIDDNDQTPGRVSGRNKDNVLSWK